MSTFFSLVHKALGFHVDVRVTLTTSAKYEHDRCLPWQSRAIPKTLYISWSDPLSLIVRFDQWNKFQLSDGERRRRIAQDIRNHEDWGEGGREASHRHIGGSVHWPTFLIESLATLPVKKCKKRMCAPNSHQNCTTQHSTLGPIFGWHQIESCILVFFRLLILKHNFQFDVNRI